MPKIQIMIVMMLSSILLLSGPLAEIFSRNTENISATGGEINGLNILHSQMMYRYVLFTHYHPIDLPCVFNPPLVTIVYPNSSHETTDSKTNSRLMFVPLLMKVIRLCIHTKNKRLPSNCEYFYFLFSSDCW